MNFCCAAGNCIKCWRYWVRHNTIPSFVMAVWFDEDGDMRADLAPIVNHDSGDEDAWAP